MVERTVGLKVAWRVFYSVEKSVADLVERKVGTMDCWKEQNKAVRMATG